MGAHQLAATRAAAMARRQQSWEQAASRAGPRLDLADKAHARGDIFLAARFYASLARSRPQTPVNDAARQRLEGLAKESRQKLAEIDRQLEEFTREISPGDWKDKRYWPDDLAETVDEAFRQYEQVVDDYGAVSAVKRELASHLAKQRRHPNYAAVLNEPEAATLLELAHQHEAEDNACCAYWVYEEAAKLAPAPAALRAADRLAEMKQDRDIVAAAERCRKLQWCHRRFNLAEQLVKVKPEKAIVYYEEIVANSPAESEVHKTAQTRLTELATIR